MRNDSGCVTYPVSLPEAQDKDEFFRYMMEDWPPKLPDYHNIIRLNRGEASLV